jgi:hypothetical protein
MNAKGIKFEKVQTRSRGWKTKALQLAANKKPFALIGFDIASHQKFYNSLKKYQLNQNFIITPGPDSSAYFWSD